jgi:hypothetical protein
LAALALARLGDRSAALDPATWPDARFDESVAVEANR